MEMFELSFHLKFVPFCVFAENQMLTKKTQMKLLISCFKTSELFEPVVSKAFGEGI